MLRVFGYNNMLLPLLQLIPSWPGDPRPPRTRWTKSLSRPVLFPQTETKAWQTWQEDTNRNTASTKELTRRSIPMIEYRDSWNSTEEICAKILREDRKNSKRRYRWSLFGQPANWSDAISTRSRYRRDPTRRLGAVPEGSYKVTTPSLSRFRWRCPGYRGSRKAYEFVLSCSLLMPRPEISEAYGWETRVVVLT